MMKEEKTNTDTETKKSCKCENYKVIADFRNDARDPRGKVIQCQDCKRIFDSK